MIKNSRVFLYSLMLLALLVRSVVPVGFMPAQSHDGKVEIVICTGSGLSTMLMDVDKVPAMTSAGHAHGDHHSDDKGGDPASHHSCPYASVLAQGLPGMVPVALPAVIHKDTHPFTLAASLPSGGVLKPWFSQGPPLS